MEIIDFQDKKWIVIAKVPADKVDDHTKLKKQYDADLVLSNKRGVYFVLEAIIDAEFEDIK